MGAIAKHLATTWISRVEAREILILAAPMTGTALVNMGMSITDTVMMGWLGTQSLAAGAVVSDLYSIVFYFMSGILATVAAIMAQAMGRKNRRGVHDAIRNGFHVTAILSVPAFLIVWNMDLVLMAFGIEGAVIALGSEYAHMMAFTAVAMLGVAVWRNVLSAFSRPRVFLVMVIVALPANGLLNYVLMFGPFGLPEMGLAGAGLSSALVAAAMLVGFVIYAHRDDVIFGYYPFYRIWRVDLGGIAEILRIGVPSGLTTLGNVGIYLVSTPIISLFGTEALAAHAIALRLAGVFYAIPVGLSQAATVRTGYAAGRSDGAAINVVKRTAIALATVSGVACLGVLAAFAGFLPDLFLPEGTETSQGLAATLIVILGFSIAAENPNVVAGGILRGLKDTRVPMLLTLAGYWGIGAPVMGLVASGTGLGAEGVWLGLSVGVYATAIFMLGRLFASEVKSFYARPAALAVSAR